MRERVGKSKKATTSSFSISTLRQPTRGFGLESSEVSQIVTGQQALNKPRSHDLSRISMRPQAKLTVNQPGYVYEQQADRVPQQVMQRMSKPAPEKTDSKANAKKGKQHRETRAKKGGLVASPPAGGSGVVKNPSPADGSSEGIATGTSATKNGEKPEKQTKADKHAKNNKIDEQTDKEKQAILAKAVTDADQILNQQGATANSVRAKLPQLESKYKLTSAKLKKDKEGAYYIKVKINPEKDTNKRKLDETDTDEPKGAFALYRGIHFNKNWNKEDYDAQLERKLVGEPTFSAAAREIAGSKKPDGSDVSKADLEAAAQRVREKVETTKDVNSVRQWWGDKKQLFDNLFFAMIQDYVNRYDKFEEELQNVKEGKYKDLKFISIPMISTSKNAQHAARYAFGQKGTLKENQRTTGDIVGRIFVYLFTAKQLIDQKAIDIQDLQNQGKVKIKARILNEAEVAFTGSIPGDNLEAQHDAQLSEGSERLGARAEQTAKQKAQSQGGLREWES